MPREAGRLQVQDVGSRYIIGVTGEVIMNASLAWASSRSYNRREIPAASGRRCRPQEAMSSYKTVTDKSKIGNPRCIGALQSAA